MGLPFSRKDVEAEAAAISGKTIGKTWYQKFLWHHPNLFPEKAARLNPKQAKNFNSTVINDYLTN